MLKCKMHEQLALIFQSCKPKQHDVSEGESTFSSKTSLIAAQPRLKILFGEKDWHAIVHLSHCLVW